MRLVTVSLLWGLVLSGCTSEDSKSTVAKVSDKQKEGNPTTEISNEQKGQVGTSSVKDDKNLSQTLPTRSELRVLSEDVDAKNNEVNEVIEQFDDNLNNRQVRKEAEVKFKQMLPEYKEKMMLIGKSKLKEANQ
ncbi:hypothetical protein A1359_21420 [Methylomonas lenta]|uniref:Lipoprotein n=1 Tax=Methylomonas lenta TaxID=980561 RepID=A0A177NPP5_9GAMM|nr:hypothetical protein [Methylomonas lenta]OAI20046.1 hypothetical protein A1359_21420 [Methylomonas lenta]